MHPMTDTVTKLYYPPQYYERLLKNIAEVERAPNMLVDKNASYDAAFYCSDAMISDYSSMMFLYLLMDKPVLWIKHGNTNGPFSGQLLTGEALIDWHWMEEARNPEAIFPFIERIRNGEDRNAYMRKVVCKQDIPLADGHCGERICNILWDAMHKEDF